MGILEVLKKAYPKVSWTEQGDDTLGESSYLNHAFKITVRTGKPRYKVKIHSTDLETPDDDETITDDPIKYLDEQLLNPSALKLSFNLPKLYVAQRIAALSIEKEYKIQRIASRIIVSSIPKNPSDRDPLVVKLEAKGFRPVISEDNLNQINIKWGEGLYEISITKLGPYEVTLEFINDEDKIVASKSYKGEEDPLITIRNGFKLLSPSIRKSLSEKITDTKTEDKALMDGFLYSKGGKRIPDMGIENDDWIAHNTVPDAIRKK